ncbi:unnamed protein product, partial [Amoebophrya sp. A25]|eukprot:GSA25T00006790001.1
MSLHQPLPEELFRGKGGFGLMYRKKQSFPRNKQHLLSSFKTSSGTTKFPRSSAVSKTRIASSSSTGVLGRGLGGAGLKKSGGEIRQKFLTAALKKKLSSSKHKQTALTVAALLQNDMRTACTKENGGCEAEPLLSAVLALATNTPMDP